MSETELHHLAAAYALDALDAAERSAFEAHYASCEICRVDVREFRAAAAALGESAATSPPHDAKARVMDEIARTRQLSPGVGAADRLVHLDEHRARRRTLTALGAMAAAVVLIVGAFVVSRSGDGFDDRVAEIVTDPAAQVAELSGDTAGQIRVTWVDDEAVVVGMGLPVPGAGEVYELWLIDDAGAHPIRLLDAAPDGTIRRVVDIADGRSPAVWGVTIEPAAGSATPTEPVLYSATV